MDNTVKSKHAKLLNDLNDKSLAFPYAAIKHILCEAEATILNQEKELESLRQQLASQPLGEPVRPDSDDFLRISKSGYSVKVGWNTEKRIVAKCPYEFNDMKGFQVWLEDAERLCDGWNRTTPPSVDVLVEALRNVLSAITKLEAENIATDALTTYSKPITEDKDNG